MNGKQGGRGKGGGSGERVLVPYLAKDARLGALVVEALSAGRRALAALLFHERREEACRVLQRAVVNQG